MNITMDEIVDERYLLYVSLVLALMAILSRFVLGIILDSISRDSENPGKKKTKFARNYKQKVEQTFAVDRVVNDTAVFVEKYIRRHRFLWISLRGWHLMAIRLLLVAVGLNVFASAYALIYEFPWELAAWSMAVNLLIIILCCLAMSFTDFNYKYAGIKVNMQNYIENEYKNHKEAIKEAEEELKQKEQSVIQNNENSEQSQRNQTLSVAEEKIIQDVIKEFL
ncbi:MAG: hypothetical protein K2M46_13050 [Lachnospiraceae bacterium]|nr:hypothetical protein [Lachnospiraceae bacterium]